MVQRTHFEDKTSFLVPRSRFNVSATLTNRRSYMDATNCIVFVLVSLNALWKNLPGRTGSNVKLASLGAQT